MEGAPKNIEKQVEQATREADPTAYSMLPTGEKRTKILRNPFVKLKIPLKTDGQENYFELDNEGHHSPKGQQVVSRMLKGVLNVADVVSEIDDEGIKKYYSLEMQNKKIEQESTTEMVQADQILLGYIFGSSDHNFNTYSGWANNASYNHGKVTHFDFGEDAYDFLRDPIGKDKLTAQIKLMKSETLLYLKEKVGLLESRFSGEGGRLFFNTIIKSTNEQITDLFGPREIFEYYPNMSPDELVYNTLIERVENLSKLISSLEN